MSSKVPPRDLTRSLLKEFLPNERAIRAFEQLFKNSNTLVPADIAAINIAIDQVNLTALTSELKINTLFPLIKILSDDIDFGLMQQRTQLLDACADLLLSSVSNGDVLTFDSTIRQWKNGGAPVSWTPIFGGSTSQSGQAYTAQIGKIVTIGRLNHASFDIQLSTLGTIAGNLQIKGLPSNAIIFSSGVVGTFANLSTSYVGVSLSMQSGSSAIDVAGLTAAATSMGASLTSANMAATTRIAGHINYIS